MFDLLSVKFSDIIHKFFSVFNFKESGLLSSSSGYRYTIMRTLNYTWQIVRYAMVFLGFLCYN